MGQYLLLRADARHIPLKSKSIHCCACSPPYFGLRNYDDARQIGLEPTPWDFVEAIRAVGREVWRVLRDDGSWWLNLGDSYSSQCGPTGGHKGLAAAQETCDGRPRDAANASRMNGKAGGRFVRDTGLAPKQLIGIPWRVAFALQADGWYVRANPPWIKPSPMPESTTDRPNVAHESVFLLTKSPRYYFDMDAVRMPSASATLARDAYTRVTSGKDGEYAVVHDHETPSNPNGRHLRTNDFFTAGLDSLIEHHESYVAHLRHVRDNGGLMLSEGGDPLAFWLSTRSYSGAHFATWPERLVRLMVLASTSRAGCCPECGKPWERVVERTAQPPMDWNYKPGDDPLMRTRPRNNGATLAAWKSDNPDRDFGFRPACECFGRLVTIEPDDDDTYGRPRIVYVPEGPQPEPVPCTVLDPFSGAATTVMTAVGLGRDAIGLDLNPAYLAMGAARVAESLRPVSKLDAPRAARPLAGQLDLF
jgi:DNA modification methylase